ncbi:MAG: FkbM family methyltransferase [Proteobacteria bacterium]|nr:FkbM family methyltransferase [Pseudomonadota bacterium]
MEDIKAQMLRLLPHNNFFYRICKRYIDLYNSENNCNILTNGELRLMRSVLPHCKTVFDVGANVGDWTALAFEIKPDLQIHCFEPSEATFRHLVARNFDAEVTYNNCGLGSSTGEATLYVYRDGSGENSLYKRRGLEDGWGLDPQTQTETVVLQALDEYCKNENVHHIDFLKVDVEGHELEVFKGALGMIAQGKIKRIQFEYGGCNIDARVLLKDIFDFFAPYGYVFYKVFPCELRHVTRYDQRLENFQYQNWVIMAPDINDKKGLPPKTALGSKFLRNTTCYDATP